MSLFENVNVLAELMVGRDPKWTEQTEYTGAPDDLGDGVYLEDSPTAIVYLKCREEVHRRSARLTPVGPVVGDTYRVTIGGHIVNFVAASAVVDDIIDGLIAALPGVPAAAALVTFEGRNADDENTAPFTQMFIAGKAEANWTLGLAIIGGGGSTQTATADFDTCNARTYLTMRHKLSTAPNIGEPSSWGSPDAAHAIASYHGWVDGVNDLGGVDRLYLELDTLASAVADVPGAGSAITYLAHVWIGPAVRETS